MDPAGAFDDLSWNWLSMLDNDYRRNWIPVAVDHVIGMPTRQHLPDNHDGKHSNHCKSDIPLASDIDHFFNAHIQTTLYHNEELSQ